MDDLISRAAAIDAHKRAAYWQDAERKIAELPAVDAVPVVHARWVFHDDDIMPWVSCSECGVCTDSTNKTPYCPYCGAKMDGERREAGE